MGAEIKSFYLAMGKYDVIVISEAPDDEIATKLILTIGSAGAVRTGTFRVFSEEEYRKLISEL
jgi:uncharacterized protein with GYD domain